MDIKELFKLAAQKNASDLHLVVGLPPLLRIDGDLSYVEGENALDENYQSRSRYPIRR